ncbi:MAG TPA: phosphotransferase [Streptosporangiaceae bacterium]|jgi:maltokinase|nr:phosphotransferase [Streptosporangiaceae bacterium]
MRLEDALAPWLQEQRWFAGKGRTLRDLAVVADTEVVAGDPALRHLMVLVSHGVTADHYQLFIGLRHDLPGWLEHVEIGTLEDGRHVYDALHDPELTRHLLRAIAGEATIESLTFHKEPGAEIDTDLDSIVLTAEQSNTSLVYGEESILKVFRRVFPGPNPDLEVTSALNRLGSPHIAEPYGAVETMMEGVATTLAILSKYLRTATDGWTLAATSVRDLYAHDLYDSDTVSAADAGGDFSGEAHRLGAATAEVHRSLAEAFGADELSPDALHDMAEQMYRRLDLAAAAVPELARFIDMIGNAYSALAKINDPVPAQRVHGDYHLGQVMRTDSGWILLDFEGEPATPLAQRRARSSPLRDVAGMLRSFDYAARFQLLTNPDAEQLHDAAREWSRRNSSAFCAGYAEAGGLDPVANEVLLRALTLDKAVYEVMYEARHRPSWLQIPLESLADFPD